MKWVWDNITGQYIQLEDNEPWIGDTLTEPEKIQYLDENKKLFDQAKADVMSRLKDDEKVYFYKGDTTTAGPHRAFARMVYYKSAFMKKDIDLKDAKIERDRDKIYEMGLVDPDLNSFLGNARNPRGIREAFEKKDLLNFQKFRPDEVQPGAAVFLESLDNAIPESARMRNLSENLNKMIGTNKWFFNEDKLEFKKLLDASKKLQKLIKKNPNIKATDADFKKALDEVKKCANAYTPSDAAKSRYPERLKFLNDLKEASADILESNMHSAVSKKLKEAAKRQQEQQRKPVVESAEEQKQKELTTVAKKCATRYAEIQNVQNDKKAFIEAKTQEFLKASWFTEAAKDSHFEKVPMPGVPPVLVDKNKNYISSKIMAKFEENVLNPKPEKKELANSPVIDAAQKGKTGPQKKSGGPTK